MLFHVSSNLHTIPRQHAGGTVRSIIKNNATGKPEGCSCTENNSTNSLTLLNKHSTKPLLADGFFHQPQGEITMKKKRREEEQTTD
ncbi:hypothetical protein SP90_04755 [Halodesulfovibrio spirochaetisodalis]|uniref:Uncharacterized protein n=1 Tax=Halodesulfovibrio spirochaetisodalis TaxID=1560234 RepID=A0A1B7XH24_9BACT|nr:hypothetical protein SP90_04755 [Halodesulfovibrio spirochaetisodalis]